MDISSERNPADFFLDAMGKAFGDKNNEDAPSFSGKIFSGGQEISSGDFFKKLADSVDSGLDSLVGKNIEKPAFENAMNFFNNSRGRNYDRGYER